MKNFEEFKNEIRRRQSYMEHALSNIYGFGRKQILRDCAKLFATTLFGVVITYLTKNCLKYMEISWANTLLTIIRM